MSAARASSSPPMARAPRSAATPALPSHGWTYGQSAIVTTVGARARSSTAAPKSIFCRPGRSRSCRSRAIAPRSCGPRRRRKPSASSRCPTRDFHAELEQRFKLHLGEIAAVGARARPSARLLRRALVHCRAHRAGRRRRARHPSDRRAGPEHGPEGRRGARRGDRRCGAARPRSRRGDGAGALSALAAVRHHGDGDRHRRAQPAVLQPLRRAARWRATSASAWSTACRTSSACSSARPPAWSATCRNCCAEKRCSVMPGLSRPSTPLESAQAKRGCPAQGRA